MDYTFSAVNQTSIPLFPKKAMQFGDTLQRLLQRLVYCNPIYGPPLIAKIDLADGYYRVPLSPRVALHLAVVIPPDICNTPLIAVPLSLPMGWSQSPPFFCAYTESIADLSNTPTNTTHPPHPLLKSSQLPHHPQHDAFHPSAVVLGTRDTAPLQYTDVYIDDFIAIAQPPLHTSTLKSLLHSIDAVFSDTTDTPRRAVISNKKLQQGDVTFSTFKRVLGWDVDTHRMTIQLPVHRLQKIKDLLQPLLHKKRTSLRVLASAADASKQGIGGFWSDLANPASPPTLWRHTFPHTIQSSLLSPSHPEGTLTNSDLELVAQITTAILATQQSQHCHPHILLASDNVPTVSWLQKGSNSSSTASSFLIHQLTRYRRQRPFTFTSIFTSGDSNQIADCCSRLFHLSDSAFLDYMNTHHPVQPCWNLATPTDNVTSSMICALLNRLQPLQSLHPEQDLRTQHGTFGAPSVKISTLTPSSHSSMTPYLCYKSLRTNIGMVPWLPAGLLSALAQWKGPFVPWGRRSPHWAVPTRAYSLRGNWTSACPAN